MEQELLRQAFEVSPTTVFGVLTLVLLAGNIFQWRKNNQLQESLLGLNKDNIKLLNSIIKQKLIPDEKG